MGGVTSETEIILGGTQSRGLSEKIRGTRIKCDVTAARNERDRQTTATLAVDATAGAHVTLFADALR